MLIRIELKRHSDFVVVFGIDESGQGHKVSSCLSLFAFEKVGQLDHAQHLAAVIRKLSQDNALIFQDLPVIVVLLTTHTLQTAFFLTSHIIVRDVAISEEILYFKGIKLFFVPDYLHGIIFSLFGDKSGWCSFFKDAYLGEHEFNFPSKFINR